MIIAGEDRVSQIKKANKTRKTKFPISEAGQKRSAAAQTGDVCTVDDSPSGSRIRHLALSINSFSLNDPRVQKILSFTKLGNMTDEDVLDMVNDIRKVNGKPEIYNVTQEEVMLGGRRKTRRKRRKTKRKKKGGYASDWNPSPEQRAAMRHGINAQTYRRYVREYLRENAADGSVNNVQPSQDILDEFIRRRINEDREEEERERQRRILAQIRERAYRVRNHLPDNAEPNTATLEQVQLAERAQYRQAEQAREQARRQADIRARTVHRFIENPDGSIDLGATVAPTEEQAKAMEIHNIAQEEGLSWMDAYRRYNEIHNINTNEIPVTRPSRLRRIRDYIIGLRDRVRERRVFGRRNRTSVVPTAPPQLGGKKRRKKTRRKRRTVGGVKTKKKWERKPSTILSFLEKDAKGELLKKTKKTQKKKTTQKKQKKKKKKKKNTKK